MKLFKRKAEYIANLCVDGEVYVDWRCPSCSMGVAEEYVCCPYCGQRLKFETKKVNKTGILIKRNDLEIFKYEGKI